MLTQRLRRQLRVYNYVVYKETLLDFKSLQLSQLENIFLIGSFGASSVLIYGAVYSPLAQPRNLVGGHVVSALVGVTVGKIIPDIIWLTAPLAVALSIVAMQVTRSLHPPGGATALIAVSGGEQIAEIGYMFVFSPVFTGALILFCIALIFNNITEDRHYPVRHSRLRQSRRQQLRRRFINKI